MQLNSIQCNLTQFSSTQLTQLNSTQVSSTQSYNLPPPSPTCPRRSGLHSFSHHVSTMHIENCLRTPSSCRSSVEAPAREVDIIFRICHRMQGITDHNSGLFDENLHRIMYLNLDLALTFGKILRPQRGSPQSSSCKLIDYRDADFYCRDSYRDAVSTYLDCILTA